MKRIQVFLKGDTSAEINSELVRLRVVSTGIWVKDREQESIAEHFFPHANLQMVRIWEEKDEA